jgi:hypothetical protein
MRTPSSGYRHRHRHDGAATDDILRFIPDSEPKVKETPAATMR